MIRLGATWFAIGAAAGCIFAGGVCLGMALAERAGWPR
jgi:hypothetical protein